MFSFIKRLFKIKPSIRTVTNAFNPSKEITNPNSFAGRESFIKQGYNSLLTTGGHIAIIGNRGIGKTSIARQLVNIAKGEKKLLKKIGLKKIEKLKYHTIYFASGDSANYVEILERILTTKDNLGEKIYRIPAVQRNLSGLTGSSKKTVGFSESELSAIKEHETTSSLALTSHPINSIFHNVTSEIVKTKYAKDGLFIVIDEFDRVKDQSGFASFLKSLATNVPKVKFCIVGVSQDIQELIDEHRSVDRLFAGHIISLPKMSPKELEQIIHSAEEEVNHSITFNPTAIDKLISLSDGHPYLTHLVGKYSLMSAYNKNLNEVTPNIIDDTLKDIAEKEYDPILEKRYKEAIKNSKNREIVLKSLAQSIQPNGEIPTTIAYSLAEERGVQNPAQYLGQLVTVRYGAELTRVQDRYYRFGDSLFVAYVKARPNLMSW